MVVCMLAPLGQNTTRYAMDFLEAATQEGAEGCWNTKRALNTQAFKDKFLNWLSQQPQDCAEGIYTNQ